MQAALDAERSEAAASPELDEDAILAELHHLEESLTQDKTALAKAAFGASSSPSRSSGSRSARDAERWCVPKSKRTFRFVFRGSTLNPVIRASSASAFPMEWTFANLQRQRGGIPLARIHLYPWPGLATERDVLHVHSRTGSLCELIDGILVEKPMGFYESALVLAVGGFLREYLKSRNLGSWPVKPGCSGSWGTGSVFLMSRSSAGTGISSKEFSERVREGRVVSPFRSVRRLSSWQRRWSRRPPRLPWRSTAD